VAGHVVAIGGGDDLFAFWVGGGSTANLLAVWGRHGLDELLREAHADGAALAGVSAGMNGWFEAGTTESFGPGRR
jgi:dipeptidase E